MAFKTPEQLKERKAFIADADNTPELMPAMPARELSIKELSKKTNEVLEDEIVQIYGQCNLGIWKRLAAIRLHFESDTLFGQHIAKLRDSPTGFPVPRRQQEINECVHIAIFCEKHRITDLKKVGISLSGLKELARPSNAEVSTAIFKKVKNEGRTLDYIKKLIADAKNPPIEYDEPPEEPQQPTKSEHREPYTIEVVNGIAIVSQPPEQPEIEREVAEAAILEQVVVKQYDYPKHEHKEAEPNRDEEIIVAILAFVDQYQLSPLKMIGLLQGVIERLRGRIY